MDGWCAVVLSTRLTTRITNKYKFLLLFVFLIVTLFGRLQPPSLHSTLKWSFVSRGGGLFFADGLIFYDFHDFISLFVRTFLRIVCIFATSSFSSRYFRLPLDELLRFFFCLNFRESMTTFLMTN